MFIVQFFIVYIKQLIYFGCYDDSIDINYFYGRCFVGDVFRKWFLQNRRIVYKNLVSEMGSFRNVNVDCEFFEFLKDFKFNQLRSFCICFVYREFFDMGFFFM